MLVFFHNPTHCFYYFILSDSLGLERSKFCLYKFKECKKLTKAGDSEPPLPGLLIKLRNESSLVGEVARREK